METKKVIMRGRGLLRAAGKVYENAKGNGQGRVVSLHGWSVNVVNVGVR